MRLWQLTTLMVLLMVGLLGVAWFLAQPMQGGVWKQCKLLTNDGTAGAAGEVCDEFGRR
jgi:hypothetical protein